MRISGWLRLWIVVSMAWLCIIAIFTWKMWPQIENISHEPYFLTLVKPQSALFKCLYENSSEKCENSATFIVDMPNGYRLLLAVSESNKDAEKAAMSYWHAVELKYKAVINKHLLYSGMFWLISSLAVLAFGVGVAWVNRGFRESP
jgi:hypothetical protein